MGAFAFIGFGIKKGIFSFCHRFRSSSNLRVEVFRIHDSKACKHIKSTNSPHMFQCFSATVIRNQIKAIKQHPDNPKEQSRVRLNLNECNK